MNDALHSLGSDRNMNEQLHRPVLFAVCMMNPLSNVNTKEVPRKGKEHASHMQIASLYEAGIQQYAVLCLGLLAVNCSRGNGMKPQ